MESIQTIEMNDGKTIPMLGYGLGTANMNIEHEDVVKATRMAIESGYYHLDGAEMYGNEAALGVAIKESGIPRDKLFVTTKVLGRPGQDVHASLNTSLEKLGLDYVDLMWAEMEAIKSSGKAKSIGVSNFLQAHLEDILKTAKVVPAINQIEYHPYLQHGSLVEFCHKNNIAVSAYSPLTAITKTRPGPVDEVYASLAEKYAVTEADIAIRWCLDQNIVAITTSSSKERLEGYKTNLAKFKLLPDEVKQISDLGSQKHYRVYYNEYLAPDDRS
ncbi:hypothetical protein K445DRAFT_76447 [Daldinia sp. EC12]|nr:hypothetical protein K445DRAFT_76447 [Daldinia sp. EC12]